MDAKETNARLFSDYQPLVVRFLNTKLGRLYTEIDHHNEIRDKKIVSASPNSFTVKTGQVLKDKLGHEIPELQTVIRGYELLAKKLSLPLTSLAIYDDWLTSRGRLVTSRYETLLHFLGIRRISILPSFMFETADPVYAVAGDGSVTHWVSSGWSFSHARGAGDGDGDLSNNGTASGDAQSLAGISVYSTHTQGGMIRAFLPYDTSVINGGTVTAGNIHQFVCTTSPSEFSGSIGITTQTMANPLSLANNDYDNITLNSPTELITRKTILGTSKNAMNTWGLNAAGLAAVSTSGYTLFCVRGSFDIDNSDPSASDGEDFIRTRYSEYTGTSSDPYLDITYTPRPSVIQYNFM